MAEPRVNSPRQTAVTAAGAAVLVAGTVAVGLPLIGGIIGAGLGAVIPYLADHPEHMGQGAIIAGLSGVVLGGIWGIAFAAIILATGAIGAGAVALAARKARPAGQPAEPLEDADE
jgi:hypothetical protein